MILPCPHWIWVEEEETPTTTIARSNRLEQLTSSLDRHDLAPSLVLMIGCRHRPAPFRRSIRHPGRICLDLDKEGEVPLLIATAALHPRSIIKIPCCRPVVEHHVATRISKSHTDAIYSQLLYPFTDIICFYAYSTHDLESISKHMAAWFGAGQPAIQTDYRPHALVVLAGRHWRQRNDESISTQMNTLKSFFPGISFLRLGRTSHFAVVRSALTQHAQTVRQRRREARVLFSMQHFGSLFDRAFDAVGNSSGVPFDYLHLARQDFTVAPDIASHFETFIRQVPLPTKLRAFAAPVIASSILLDQYPPGMHLFKPSDVYHKLYESACLQAANAVFHQDHGLWLPNTFCNLILASLKSFFERLVQGESASSVHRTVLTAYTEEWQGIQGSSSCFTCLKSSTQYTLDCSHAICENCVKIFGRSEAHDPHLIRLPTCTLCQAPVYLTVRVLPPTAGHRILCIDGGGVGGIIPSTVLELLQDRLDLPIPIQEHFSLAYGVSVGGLVVLGLYEKGWSAATCTSKLQTLAEEAFSGPVSTFLFLFCALKWIRLFFLGSLYTERGIEGALQGVFGDKRMAIRSYATATGTKIGILTASLEQPRSYLFTNYNGFGGLRPGYHVSQNCDSIKTWEIARSTSAAPMYFSPYYIQGLGTFQDGGVLRNNPTLVALSEFSKLGANAKPDIVINLGTGSSPEPVLEDRKSSEYWRDGWLPRLVWAYLSFLQGQRTWNDVACLVDARDNGHYRLDVTVKGKVRLDDTTAMPLLKSLVLKDSTLHDTIGELANRLFATLFYFELKAVPTSCGSRFHVHGHVLCTRKVGDLALPQIQQRLRRAVLSVDDKALHFKIAEDTHGNICLTLVFIASQSFRLELSEGRAAPSFPLSGSPYNISELVMRSGLKASFGTRAHKRKTEDDLRESSIRRRLR